MTFSLFKLIFLTLALCVALAVLLSWMYGTDNDD